MKKKFLTGTIKRNPDGFGFLIPDKGDHPDVYIPRHSMEQIMTSDKVMVEVEPEHGGERFRGEVVRIIERGIKKVVGQYFKVNESHGIIRDEGKGWGQDLKIANELSMNAANGELVAATILTYPDNKKGFQGQVTELIGDAKDPMMDIKRILLTNNIPHEFSTECLREAEKFKEHVSDEDIKGRRDLRSLKFITIDGATAKDFDDAIYIETNTMGFLLYVAIADVSHYVQVNSAIDRDAYERGTSVYYPNHVTPMLPEVLSNGLCSLNPHVPRLSLVAEMQMDFTGTVQNSNFYEAVIESKARVTYGEAQEIIDGNHLEKLKHVEDEIRRASDLAKVLMAKRFREGSLDLEIPETQLVIDAAGNPVDIIRSERLFAHRVIEEMMLSANVAVAKFLSSKNIPAIYRIHEPPNPMAIGMLETYMRNFGSTTPLSVGKLQKRLTKALEEFEGKPQAQVLHILTLRSMSQAKYSHQNVGHFGLGFEFYTHFTSPIRRYPDLIVHRLLKNLIMPQSKYRLMSEDDLATAGTWLSACEQRAVKSERQLVSIKKARFMHQFIGQELDGMISSVTKFGVFVLLRTYEIDGLVRMEDLGPVKYEKFEFDEEQLKLVSKRSGLSFSIGDQIKVRVLSVDIEAGQINFEHAVERKEAAFVERRGQGDRRGGNDRRQSQSEKSSRMDEILKSLEKNALPRDKSGGGKNHRKKSASDAGKEGKDSKNGKKPYYSKFKSKNGKKSESQNKRRGQAKKRRR